ncbi:hypothetical protein HPB50_028739 [Hyalomma asiaticum]|nr:hypothetical protein HPB50_028739 [Hyalomma asiaticum]
MGSNSPTETQRQLAGFGGPLDWRPLVFVESVPYVYCCTLCGVLAAFPKRLSPCCHVYCPLCFEKFVDEKRLCPLDQTPLTDRMIETLDSGHTGVNQLRARCPNATNGCTFVAQLSELKGHLVDHCEQNSVQCPRCGLDIAHRAALTHYLKDCPGVRKHITANEDARATTDASYDCLRIRKALSANSVVGSTATKDRNNEPRKSSSDDTATRKPPNTVPFGNLSQDNHEQPKRSFSSGFSVPSSMHLATTSSSDSAEGSDKQDTRRETNEAATSKIVVEITAGHKTLSAAQLLEKVESMMERAAKNAAQAATSAETAVPQDTSARETQQPSRPPGYCKRSTSAGLVASPSAKLLHHSRKVTMRDAYDKRGTDNGVNAATSSTGFTFCYITGLVGSDTHLVCGQELYLRSNSSSFAGCVLRVHARLRRDDNGIVFICFKLCICGGAWRRVAELVLSERISLVLVHPWDQTQNEPLPLCLKSEAMPRGKDKNPLGRWDFWEPTAELKLRELATRGFVSSGALCVAIAIE